MNDWEERITIEAKRRKVYAEMRDCMKKIKDKVGEETLESYVSLLTKFIRGRSSLLEIDEFAGQKLAEVRDSHEQLFTHLLDGAQVPIGSQATEKASKNKSKELPSQSAITTHLFLMGARHGIEEIDPAISELISHAITYHVKGIVEDAVKVQLPYLVSPSGSLRLNATTNLTEQRKQHRITMRDVRDGIEMADGSPLWVMFASADWKNRLRRRFAEAPTGK